jgi:hypothetical protein
VSVRPVEIFLLFPSILFLQFRCLFPRLCNFIMINFTKVIIFSIEDLVVCLFKVLWNLFVQKFLLSLFPPALAGRDADVDEFNENEEPTKYES